MHILCVYRYRSTWHAHCRRREQLRCRGSPRPHLSIDTANEAVTVEVKVKVEREEAATPRPPPAHVRHCPQFDNEANGNSLKLYRKEVFMKIIALIHREQILQKHFFLNISRVPEKAKWWINFLDFALFNSNFCFHFIGYSNLFPSSRPQQVIKFCQELLMLLLISYELSFSAYARLPEFWGKITN